MKTMCPKRFPKKPPLLDLKKNGVDKANPTPASFDSLGLDPRLLQAVVHQKFPAPTPVQAHTIPLALQGKDILARSKTGSGKTAAYVLPILQSILARNVGSTSTKTISTLVLVPTRELAGQVTKAFEAFAAFCAQDVRIENITRKEDDKVQRARLAGSPDILVATPGRIAVHLNSSALSLDGLTHLVIDEADLILSYGYDEDLQTISKSVPKGVQTFLMSATLKADLDSLKGLFCRNPVVLSLDEEESDDGKVSQYIVKCAEDEKFLLCYAIFILKLIKGKTIIFVGDIDRCYRLKLFLEQFAIKSCVLNSELPVNSRIHVVEEFNKNVYDIIIATDEHEILGNEYGPGKPTKSTDEAAADGDGEDGKKQLNGEKKENDENLEIAVTEPKESASEPAKKKRKGPKRDKDYGVARGIDFKNVACVLNFDLPTSSRSYTHRIGRTARAGKTGMALSFVIPKTEYRKHKPTSISSAKHDEEVLSKITKQQEKKGSKVEPYAFDMKKLEGFRYRLGDALRAVTNGAIREARVKELRQELIKSEKLKRHFEENPEDLRHLRHDGELRAARVQPHLRHVPDYLIPGGGAKAIEGDAGFVALNSKSPENKMRKGRGRGGRKVGAARKGPNKKANPLQTFKSNARG